MRSLCELIQVSSYPLFICLTYDLNIMFQLTISKPKMGLSVGLLSINYVYILVLWENGIKKGCNPFGLHLLDPPIRQLHCCLSTLIRCISQLSHTPYLTHYYPYMLFLSVHCSFRRNIPLSTYYYFSSK